MSNLRRYFSNFQRFQIFKK